MIRKTMDYFSMVDLFVRSGLEISPEDPAPEGMITCFELLDEAGVRQAAGGLCRVNGEYVLRHVAVEEDQRGKGYGKQMVETVMAEAESLGAKRIWLTGKVPEFYEKLGFRVVSRDAAPFQTKCGECPQYHNGCESEVMVYEFASL